MERDKLRAAEATTEASYKASIREAALQHERDLKESDELTDGAFFLWDLAPKCAWDLGGLLHSPPSLSRSHSTSPSCRCTRVQDVPSVQCSGAQDQGNAA